MQEPAEMEVFRGDESCKHWQGITDAEKRRCCGGKKVEIMGVRCSKIGRMPGNYCGKPLCGHYQPSSVKQTTYEEVEKPT
jgi:hypothetical protein